MLSIFKGAISFIVGMILLFPVLLIIGTGWLIFSFLGPILLILFVAFCLTMLMYELLFDSNPSKPDPAVHTIDSRDI